MWSTRRHSIQWFRRAVGKREIRARCCVCLAEAFLLAFVPAIGNVRAETLEEVLVKTYLSNPTLFAAREQLRVTNENLPQAIANWLPTISLTETKGRSVTKTIQEPPRTTAISKTQNASLAYTQNLYKGGINFATLRKARHQIANERANLRNTEQTVVSNAITAYMDVLRDRITRDHRRNNVEALKKRLETTQIQFDLRQRTLGALSQAQSRLACAEATFTAAESTLETSQATFTAGRRRTRRRPGPADRITAAAAVDGSCGRSRQSRKPCRPHSGLRRRHRQRGHRYQQRSAASDPRLVDDVKPQSNKDPGGHRPTDRASHIGKSDIDRPVLLIRFGAIAGSRRQEAGRPTQTGTGCGGAPGSADDNQRLEEYRQRQRPCQIVRTASEIGGGCAQGHHRGIRHRSPDAAGHSGRPGRSSMTPR